MCEISFADGYKLTVTDANQFGVASDAQRAPYRDFVRDLHARLAAHAGARSGARIAFTAGYPPARFRVLMVCTVLLGLISVGVPIAVLLLAGDPSPLVLLIVGMAFMFPLLLMMTKNAPRTYEAAEPPDELVE